MSDRSVATVVHQLQQEAKLAQWDFDEKRNWPNDEAAAYLGTTPDTLRVWVSKRKVPFVRVGRLVRFRKKDLDQWLEKNFVPAEAR